MTKKSKSLFRDAIDSRRERKEAAKIAEEQMTKIRKNRTFRTSFEFEKPATDPGTLRNARKVDKNRRRK
jgi:hypothetical protein